MNGLVLGDLILVTEQTGAHGALRVFWRGKSNERDPGKTLTPFFGTLLESAKARRATIEFHFGAIEYVNSSTLGALVQFIRECRGAAVKLAIVYDDEQKWQRLSFDALRVFVKDDDLLELRPLVSRPVSTFTFNIDVPIRSEWSNIDLLFTSVKTCFAAMLADVDGCHTIAMVTSELLENAIKYGDWSGKERSFRFHVSGEGRKARVSVHSPVKDPAEAMANLEATLRWIDGFPSPEAAYQARLLEIAAAGAAGSSRLGLARIAYQAGCKLRAERDGQGVRVIAELTL